MTRLTLFLGLLLISVSGWVLISAYPRYFYHQYTYGYRHPYIALLPTRDFARGDTSADQYPHRHTLTDQPATDQHAHGYAFTHQRAAE